MAFDTRALQQGIPQVPYQGVPLYNAVKTYEAETEALRDREIQRAKEAAAIEMAKRKEEAAREISKLYQGGVPYNATESVNIGPTSGGVLSHLIGTPEGRSFLQGKSQVPETKGKARITSPDQAIPLTEKKTTKKLRTPLPKDIAQVLAKYGLLDETTSAMEKDVAMRQNILNRPKHIPPQLSTELYGIPEDPGSMEGYGEAGGKILEPYYLKEYGLIAIPRMDQHGNIYYDYQDVPTQLKRLQSDLDVKKDKEITSKTDDWEVFDFSKGFE